MTGPNERDEITAVLAKVAQEHALAGTKHERARHRDFHECSCGTRHPVYADGRWPTHAEHVASEESGALTDWLAERDRRTAATALREAAAESPLLLLNIGSGLRESYVRVVDLRDRAERIERGE